LGSSTPQVFLHALPAGGVIKQVKNSPKHFRKYKPIKTIACHSFFTHFHMPTQKIEWDLASVAPVLSASNFVLHDPCTCLSRPVLKMTPFGAVWKWIGLILFAATLLPTCRRILLKKSSNIFDP
jgi:hypothetical protein